MLATIALTVDLFIKTPKGCFPQDDTGLIFGVDPRLARHLVSRRWSTAAAARRCDIVLADPAVATLGSSVGGSGWNASVNQGRMFISLKPLAERDDVIDAARDRAPAREARTHPRPRTSTCSPRRTCASAAGRASSQYQFTLWSSDLDELLKWVPKVLERVQGVPGIVDVTTRPRAGRACRPMSSIDRPAAARLGVRIQDIDNALNNAFAQRQISTIYTQRNQYRVVLEIDPRFQRDPNDLSSIYVPGVGNAQVPLSAVAQFERGDRAARRQPPGSVPVGHDHLRPAARHRRSTTSISDDPCRRSPTCIMPDIVHAEFAGDAKAVHAERRRAGHSRPRGADRRLHRARRALREPRASADDHLDAALGGPRRADRPAASPARN